MSKRRPVTDLEAHAIGASTYLLHAYEVALEFAIDGVDEEVVRDQLDASGGHVASAIRMLHPEWRHLTDTQFGDAATGLFRSLRPDVDMSLDGPDGAITLIKEAIERARLGAECAAQSGGSRRQREIALELHFAREHLECALFVLDPVPFFADVDAAGGTAKDALVSRLNRIELEVWDHREQVRERYAPSMP